MKNTIARVEQFLEKIVYYPVLFAINDILLLAGPNMARVKLTDTAAPILVWGGVAAGLLILWSLLFKNRHRGGLVTLIALLWFGKYGLLAQTLDALPWLEMAVAQHLVLMVMWSAFWGLLISPWLWEKIKKPSTLTVYFNFLMPILVVFSFSRIVWYQLGKVAQEPADEKTADLLNLTADVQPDIYYIIPDGYGRQDVLREVYSLDNQEFIDALKARGFYVAEQSHANYVRTMLALSASLNYAYLPDLPPDSPDMQPLEELMAHNRVERSLEASGYRVYAINSGIFVAPQRILESLFWLNSVAALPIDANWVASPMPRNRDFQRMFDSQVEQVKTVAALPGPKYIFAHLLLPHPPFIFDRNGPIAPERVYRLTDGEIFPGTPEEYIQGYREQVLYVNDLLIEIIDSILANNPTPPAIIIQGDHGGGAYLDESGPEKSCMRERFSILSAYYLPNARQNQLYASITPVNSFRVVFNAYFDTQLELLPDESYYSPIPLPYQLTRVTDWLDQPCQVP
jgi:hypothetical protein